MTTLRVDRYALADLAADRTIVGAAAEFAASIRKIRKMDALLELLLDRIFERIPAERGVVLLAGPKAGDLQPAVFRGAEFAPNSAIAAQALREGLASLTAVPSSLLCVPLGDTDLGAVYLKSGRRKAFTRQHLHLLIAIAAEAAVPIDYTRHIERVERENEEFRNYTYVDRGIVGESQAIREIHKTIKKVARLDSRVLILGESGTGKDLVARAIHANSPRNGVGPFVAVNCAAFTDTLIETELFGHERGAFSGAVALKKGTVEAANGGTLFLDEVAELSPRAQAALLRFLESGEFRRVGSNVTLRSDVRIVAATNRNMQEWIETGKFRADLYYRLRTVEFRMPALRERRDDIPLLARHFLLKFRQSTGSPREFSPVALAVLRRYDWPGNVRELHSAVEQAVIFCDSGSIEPRHLPRAVAELKAGKAGHSSYRARLKAFTTEMTRSTLAETLGNHAEAARILKISPSYMRRLARRLGVKQT